MAFIKKANVSSFRDIPLNETDISHKRYKIYNICYKFTRDLTSEEERRTHSKPRSRKFELRLRILHGT